MLATLKHQRIENNEHDATKLMTLKHPRVNMHSNKKKEGLNKYQSKGYRYVLFFLFSQKESNCPTDLSKRIKILNHLIKISKLPHQIIINFAFKFLDRKN